jgi:hypothetical protein
VDTYLYAYHSGTKPWSFDLSDDYLYAGEALNSIGYYGDVLSASDYHYRIDSDDGLSLGINPGSNFENAYFTASGKKAGCGTIETQDLVIDASTQSGTVYNGTDHDFPYLMLLSDEYAVVLADVKAGQTVEIDGNAVLVTDASYWDDVYYNFVGYQYSSAATYMFSGSDEEIDQEMASALYTGVSKIRSKISGSSDKILVAGCTKDFEPATSGKCAEISYGCLYTIAEQEVSDAAN